MKKVTLLLLLLISLKSLGQSLESIYLKGYKEDQVKLFSVTNDLIAISCDTSSSWNGVYRFTWLPSFDNPIIITLKKEGGVTIAIAKFIELQSPEDYLNPVNVRVDTVELQREQWIDFTKTILDEALFWFLPENCINPQSDGAGWIIEAVNPNQRNTIVIQSPKKGSSVYNIGLYMTKLFQFEELY